MIARLLAIIASMLPPVAAAQNPKVPAGLDLNGTWELVERGERQDKNNPLVIIEHTGARVTAKFLTGAECFDGTRRDKAFDGQLSFPAAGGASLSSNNMFVCSGSPSVVQKCGGTIKAMYQSRFTDVIVTPDLETGKPNLIAGKRFAQGYRGCDLDPSSDGTHDFSLRRLRAQPQ